MPANCGLPFVDAAPPLRFSNDTLGELAGLMLIDGLRLVGEVAVGDDAALELRECELLPDDDDFTNFAKKLGAILLA